jgi:hypothetical protein
MTNLLSIVFSLFMAATPAAAIAATNDDGCCPLCPCPCCPNK